MIAIPFDPWDWGRGRHGFRAFVEEDRPYHNRVFQPNIHDDGPFFCYPLPKHEIPEKNLTSLRAVFDTVSIVLNLY